VGQVEKSDSNPTPVRIGWHRLTRKEQALEYSLDFSRRVHESFAYRGLLNPPGAGRNLMERLFPTYGISPDWVFRMDCEHGEI
jgi:hypothetical protein